MISQPVPGGPRRLILLAGIVVFVCLIASYLVLDAALAVVGKRPAPVVEPKAYSNVLGDLEPHLSLVAREIPGLPYGVATNDQGLRGGRNVSPRPAANALRVLCLGDSFTYGVGVDDRFTYPALLEQFLQARLPDRTVEVLNAGVPFYDIFDETAYFLEKGRRMRPDVVVLQFYINDLEAMAGAFFREGLLAREGGVYNRLDQMTGREGVERRLNDWLWNRFPGFVDFWREGGQPAGPFPKDRPVARCHIQATDEERALLGDRMRLLDQASLPAMARFWDNYRHALVALRDAVQASGAAFLLVLAPDVGQVREDRNAPAAALVGFCRENGIPVIDLARQFRKMAGEKTDRYYLLPYNGHPNVDGNTLMAKAVADALQASPGASRLPIGVAPVSRAFDYSGPVSLNLRFDGQGGVLPARNGPVAVATVSSDNLTVRVDKGAGNDIAALMADLRRGPTGRLVLRLDSDVPLAQVSLTFFRRLFPPINGFVQLEWSRDGEAYEALAFASDKDVPAPESLETSRLVELDLRDKPARQLYFRIVLRNEAWIFVESREPPWRRFEVVCYPAGETAGQARGEAALSPETTDRPGWPDGREPGPD